MFFKIFSRKPIWIAAILTTVTIAWLHFFFWFHVGGFWRDEVNSINIAGRHSLGEMSQDSFPVLMPLLLHGWLALGLGQSDLELRTLGLLIGLGIPASLCLTAWIVKHQPPLLGLILFGLNSTVIFWGDTLRPYGFGSLLIVLMMAAMCGFLKKPSWFRAMILLTVAVLNVQTLYQNAVLFAAVCFGAWVTCWRRKDWPSALKILWCSLLTAASLLPYRMVIPELLTSTATRRTGFLLQMSANDLETLVDFPLPLYPYVWGLLIFLILFLAGRSLLNQKEAKPVERVPHFGADDLATFAGTTLLAAFMGFIGFLWLNGLRTQTWYFLPLLALATVCLDLGLPLDFWFRPLRTVVFGFMIATVLISVPFAHRDLSYRLTNVDLIAKRLAQEASPQDFILVTPWYLGISFEHYFKGATPWDTQPPLKDHSTHRYDLAEPEMENPQALQPLFDQIAAALQSGHRVWVVGWMDISDPGKPPHTVVGRFIWEHSHQFKLLTINSNVPVYYYEDVKLLMAEGHQ